MISKILNYLEQVKQLENNFRKYFVYMKSGVYRINWNLKYIYLDEKESVCYIKKTTFQKTQSYSIVRLFKKLLSHRKIVVKNGENKHRYFFNGTIYLPSTAPFDKRDIKIFSLKEKKILSIYANEDNMAKRMNPYKLFQQFFAIPHILICDCKNKLTVEELIDNNPKNLWSDYDYYIIIKTIFNNYNNYYKWCGENKNFILSNQHSKLLNNIKKEREFLELYTIIEHNVPEKLLFSSFPIVLQHGDLWLYNTLLNSKKVYFIDWEHMGEYFFLYDIFWCMQNEVIYNNNYTYIGKYLNGDYDVYFKELFQCFNIIFEESERYAYFNIALLEIIDKRILGNGSSGNEVASKLFITLLKNIEKKCYN